MKGDFNMECMFYSFTTQGILIKDTITENQCHYIGYSLKQAIKRHRQDNGLQRKHFRLIKI